jgi:hypothetical protein
MTEKLIGQIMAEFASHQGQKVSCHLNNNSRIDGMITNINAGGIIMVKCSDHPLMNIPATSLLYYQFGE